MSFRKPITFAYFAKAALVWIGGCLVAIALVWAFALNKIDTEKAEAEQAFAALAANYSQAYAEQLDRAIAQIEQLTLSLQFQWEQNPAMVSLENQLMYGVFPRSAGLHISIVGHDGKGVTSTLPGEPLDASTTEYFKFHQSSADTRLRVDQALVEEPPLGKPALRFTRRLEKEDSSFNGVIVVWVEPSFLAAFNDEENLKSGDFISVRHENGALLVSEKSRDIRAESQIHVEPPAFQTASGLTRVPGEKFKDGNARIIAWKKHNKYPLVSYASLTEASHLAGHLKRAAEYKRIASAVSGFILLVFSAGLWCAIRQQARKQQDEEVRAIFRLATDSASEGFYMLRSVYGSDMAITDFVYEDCNEHGAMLVGRSKAQLIGATLTQLSRAASRDVFLAACQRAMAEGFHEEEVRVSSDSPLKARWIYWRLVRSGQGLAVTIRNISDRKDQEIRLLDMANTDSLTGLANRHWLLNFLPKALDGARQQQDLLSVLFVDLDGFKDINDTLGHAAGDRLLQAVAARLKSLLRPHDHVVRLGGDEFTVVLTAVASQAEIAHVASRICQSFHEPFQIVTHSWLIRASIGISVFPQDSVTAEALLQRADIAMYAAKEEERGAFRFYNEQLYDRLRGRLQTEGELAQAIMQDQFVMHYQPRVNTRTGELVGLEALVRWQHPQRGMVPPNEFIPLAEKTGAIIPLGELILKKVCAQLSYWRTAGEPVVPVSVNISARQFNAGGVDRLLASLLEQYVLPPSLIEAELTESAMMNESQDILGQVAALNALGITIHVDDFGTGYSSLARLQELNTHVLKIDRAFTSKLGKDSAGETLFKSIVSMGKGLNMRIVAEGVETLQQLELLQAFDCDEVQGYYVSKPLPVEAIPSCLRKQFLFQERPAMQPD